MRAIPDHWKPHGNKVSGPFAGLFFLGAIRPRERRWKSSCATVVCRLTSWRTSAAGSTSPGVPSTTRSSTATAVTAGALWWLTLHQDDPGLLPAYFDRIGLLARLGRPFGVATGVLNTIIGQRANSARAPPGPGGRLPISVGEFDSLHGALAEFAEGIYRGGLKPGTLRQVKPRKKPRTTRRSIRLAGFSIHYLPVRVKPGARQLKITVKATRGRPPDVRLVIGGPSGRTITPRSQGATQKITARLRNRKDRRTIILIVTSGYQNPTAYRITHQARYR